MKSHQKGFTLIELLVVIAIIAILAAILFPVFAQAKDSAKNSALLSNIKQAGLANLMYSADYDDTFPLIWREGTDVAQGDKSWLGAIQPYTKNWGVLLNPKLQPPSGDYAWWQRTNHLGTLPRASSIQSVGTTGYFTTSWNNLPTKSDGVMGAVSGWYHTAAPSLSQTQVQDVANNVLISEAGAWDYFIAAFNATNPFGYCGNWGAPYNVHPNVYAGPTTTTRPKGGISGLQASGCYVPDGMTTYVATDGSAKAVDFRGRLMETITLNDGTKALKRFWPQGQ